MGETDDAYLPENDSTTCAINSLHSPITSPSPQLAVTHQLSPQIYKVI